MIFYFLWTPVCSFHLFFSDTAAVPPLFRAKFDVNPGVFFVRFVDHKGPPPVFPVEMRFFFPDSPFFPLLLFMRGSLLSLLSPFFPLFLKLVLDYPFLSITVGHPLPPFENRIVEVWRALPRPPLFILFLGSPLRILNLFPCDVATR